MQCKVAWYKLDCCKVCMLRINRNKHYNHSLEKNCRRQLISSFLYGWYPSQVLPCGCVATGFLKQVLRSQSLILLLPGLTSIPYFDVVKFVSRMGPHPISTSSLVSWKWYCPVFLWCWLGDCWKFLHHNKWNQYIFCVHVLLAPLRNYWYFF